MASVLANGISLLSQQPIIETLNRAPGFPISSPNHVKIWPHSRTFRIQADVSFESQTTMDSPGKTSSDEDDPLEKFLRREYKWGFSEEIDSFTIPKGLSKETIRLISSRKSEPDWMFEFRLKSYEKFVNMEEPKWSNNKGILGK